MSVPARSIQRSRGARILRVILWLLAALMIAAALGFGVGYFVGSAIV